MGARNERKRRSYGAFGKLVGQVIAAILFAAGAMIAPPGAFSAESGDLRPIAQRPADLDKKNPDFELYLDRLMMAESGGRDLLKNPRSSALGPYQFIKGTFLYVVRRSFTERVAGLSVSQILALRTDRSFAREVIAEYSHELARHLDRHGLAPNYGNLRLAYLLGPTGATRVLSAESDTPVRRIISAAAIAANPFLSGMTASDIIARAHRDISMDRSKRLVVARRQSEAHAGGPATSQIQVRCNLARPSCRRWLALRKKKLRKESAARLAKAGESNR